MARLKRISPAFIDALAQGKTVIQAAAAAGISERTASRRLEDPEIVSQIYQQRSRLTELAVDRLNKALDPICAQLLKLAYEAKSEYVQMSAVRTVIKAAGDLQDRHELSLRVHDLEEQLEAMDEAGEQEKSEAAEYWPPSLDAGPPRVAGMSRADAIRHNAVWLKYRSNDRGIPEEEKASLRKTADQLLQNAERIDAPDPDSDPDPRRTDFQSVPKESDTARRGFPDPADSVRRGSPDPAETPDRRSPSVAQPSASQPDPPQSPVRPAPSSQSNLLMLLISASLLTFAFNDRLPSSFGAGGVSPLATTHQSRLFGAGDVSPLADERPATQPFATTETAKAEATTRDCFTMNHICPICPIRPISPIPMKQQVFSQQRPPTIVFPADSRHKPPNGISHENAIQPNVAKKSVSRSPPT